jgi:hypothetical protein
MSVKIIRAKPKLCPGRSSKISTNRIKSGWTIKLVNKVAYYYIMLDRCSVALFGGA